MKYALSPMDYYFYRPSLYTIQFVFEYEGKLESSVLAEYLQKSAEIYRPVKCQLKIESDYKIILDENPAPIYLRSETLNDRPNLETPSEVDKLIDSVINAPGEPLVKFKLNYYESKTYMGVSFSHILGDGHSFMSFMKSLTTHLEIEAPNLNRELLFKSHQVQLVSQSLDRLFKDTGYITPRPLPPNQTKLEKLIFPFEELNRLKEGKNISSNSMMMAILLKKYHCFIPLSLDGKLLVRCPVDYRKIYSKIDSKYFGNAVKDAIAEFDPKTFEEMPLIEVAETIQQAVSKIDESAIHASLQTLDDLRLEHTTSIFQELGCPGLLVTNISKMNFNEIDFGHGSPLKIHHASQNPRLAIVLPHSGGYEVLIKIGLD